MHHLYLPLGNSANLWIECIHSQKYGVAGIKFFFFNYYCPPTNVLSVTFKWPRCLNKKNIIFLSFKVLKY